MYLDPGFGGMLVQVLVAIVAAGGIIIFSLRRKISALFSKKKDTDLSETTADAADTAKSADDVVDMLSDETPEKKATVDTADEKSDSE